MRKLWLLILGMILCLSLGSPVYGEDDFQYWSRYSLKLLDTRYVDFINYWETQFTNDASDLGTWFTSQKISFDPHRFLNLGINYTYLESDTLLTKPTRTEYRSQHRLELEITPKWQWKEWVRLMNRNRVEFRWIEGRGSDNGRYRQQWEAAFPLPKIKIPAVKDIFISNEMFLDMNIEKINENRATPIGVTFKLFGKNTLKLFYLIQSKRGSRDWSSNQVLGSQVALAY